MLSREAHVQIFRYGCLKKFFDFLEYVHQLSPAPIASYCDKSFGKMLVVQVQNSANYPLILSPYDVRCLCEQYLQQEMLPNFGASFIFVRQDLNNYSLFDVL